MIAGFKAFAEKISSIGSKYIKTGRKTLSREVSLLFDDNKYKRYFGRETGPQIYQTQINENFTCCAFCSHLTKSYCHEYCFSCSQRVYDECSPLLPGTFTFVNSYFDSKGAEYIPWIFKTPCTSFERLDNRSYFRNFISTNNSITVANYEALEGLFLGIYRGKRPCHICASVNLEIFNKCSESERTAEYAPCSSIIKEITEKYQAILGMIKYTDQ